MGDESEVQSDYDERLKKLATRERAAIVGVEKGSRIGHEKAPTRMREVGAGAVSAFGSFGFRQVGLGRFRRFGFRSFRSSAVSVFGSLGFRQSSARQTYYYGITLGLAVTFRAATSESNSACSR